MKTKEEIAEIVNEINFNLHKGEYITMFDSVFNTYYRAQVKDIIAVSQMVNSLPSARLKKSAWEYLLLGEKFKAYRERVEKEFKEGL